MALMLCYGCGAAAQEQHHQSPPYTVPQPSDTDNGLSPQQQKDMTRKLNAQRQVDIKKDTEKLLELATELKQAVDKTTENTMSLDVIKKADQIEKLAHSVKEKMKGP